MEFLLSGSLVALLLEVDEVVPYFFGLFQMLGRLWSHDCLAFRERDDKLSLARDQQIVLHDTFNPFRRLEFSV